jgi:hypothetical protein
MLQLLEWQREQRRQAFYGGGSGGCSSSSMEQCLALLDNDLDEGGLQAGSADLAAAGGALDGQLEPAVLQQKEQQQHHEHEGEHSLVDVQAGPHEGLLSAMGHAYQQVRGLMVRSLILLCLNCVADAGAGDMVLGLQHLPALVWFRGKSQIRAFVCACHGLCALSRQLCRAFSFLHRVCKCTCFSLAVASLLLFPTDRLTLGTAQTATPCQAQTCWQQTRIQQQQQQQLARVAAHPYTGPYLLRWVLRWLT